MDNVRRVTYLINSICELVLKRFVALWEQKCYSRFRNYTQYALRDIDIKECFYEIRDKSYSRWTGA